MPVVTSLALPDVWLPLVIRFVRAGVNAKTNQVY